MVARANRLFGGQQFLAALFLGEARVDTGRRAKAFALALRRGGGGIGAEGVGRAIGVGLSITIYAMILWPLVRHHL